MCIYFGQIYGSFLSPVGINPGFIAAYKGHRTMQNQIISFVGNLFLLLLLFLFICSHLMNPSIIIHHKFI